MDTPTLRELTKKLLESEENLSLHKTELEMQNEELRRAHEDLEAVRARYFDLYDLAPVGYCTLNKGLILEANLTAVAMLGMVRGDLVKQPLTRFIFKEDQDIYYLHRKLLFETGESPACKLRMVKSDGTAFWALIVMRNLHDVNRIIVIDLTGYNGSIY